MAAQTRKELRARREKVAELLLQNKTPKQIADVTGTTRQVARSDCQAILKGWSDKEVEHSQDILRAREVKRLGGYEEKLNKGFLALQKKKDWRGAASIYDRIHKILELRVKILGAAKSDRERGEVPVKNAPFVILSYEREGSLSIKAGTDGKPTQQVVIDAEKVEAH